MESKDQPSLPDPEEQPLSKTQTVGIQQATYSQPNRTDEFDGKKALICGIVIIVLVTADIAFNAGALPLLARSNQYFFNIFTVMFPAGWTGIFLYITGAFSIAAGKTKNRCLIIANMVLSIIGSVFAAINIIISGFSLAYDAGDFNSRSNTDYRILGSVILSLLMFVTAIVLLVLCVYSAVLSGRVICCPQSNAGTAQPILLQMEPVGGASVAVVAVPQHQTNNKGDPPTPPPPYKE